MLQTVPRSKKRQVKANIPWILPCVRYRENKFIDRNHVLVQHLCLGNGSCHFKNTESERKKVQMFISVWVLSKSQSKSVYSVSLLHVSYKTHCLLKPQCQQIKKAELFRCGQRIFTGQNQSFQRGIHKNGNFTWGFVKDLPIKILKLVMWIGCTDQQKSAWKIYFLIDNFWCTNIIISPQETL